eukprot:162086_1
MSDQSTISLIWSYSCRMEREKINRALCRLSTKFATGYIGRNWEEYEAKLMHDLQNSTYASRNGISNYLLSQNIISNISQFILYILFEKIIMNNIDQRTRDECLKLFAKIIHSKHIQISFNEMLKWTTNLIDWIEYLNSEEQSKSLIISKLIGSLPAKYSFDILNKSMTYDGLFGWVPIFIQCEFYVQMDTILMNENIDKQTKKR